MSKPESLAAEGYWLAVFVSVFVLECQAPAEPTSVGLVVSLEAWVLSLALGQACWVLSSPPKAIDVPRYFLPTQTQRHQC